MRHLSKDRSTQIDAACADALALLGDCFGFQFDEAPKVSLNHGEVSFSARAFVCDNETIAIEINSGCLEQIDRLWEAVLNERILIGEDGQKLSNLNGEPLEKSYLMHVSLVWLVLHELMHVRLEHLELLGVASLVEVEPKSNKSQTKISLKLAERFSDCDVRLLRSCLELQADNDATQALFGDYDEDKWDQFRIGAAAIFVVMALMERAETLLNLNEDERTYPKVGTRFFTLFAQLFQYWLYGNAKLEAGDGESFVRTSAKPQARNFERYAKTVLAFTISDAIQIAACAGVKSFLDDIGAGQGFFEDIHQIQYADDLADVELQTPAAKQWRELLPINEAFMAITGLRR